MATVTTDINPLVSIIMPTYNRAGFILETIQCIVNQSYANWELLILDDGSVDDTEKIVKNIKDNRISYHKFQRTAITGKLKNYGIHESKGELIAFMDSDDLWPIDKLEKQVNALLEYPDAGFSFTNGYNFLADRSIEAIFYKQTEGIILKNVFIPYCKSETGIFIQSILVWKIALDTAGLFNENRLFTDYSFIAQLCYHFYAVVIYEPLFFRRLHPGNNFNSINGFEDHLEHIETLNLFIKNGSLDPKLVQHSLFVAYIHSGDVLVKNRLRKRSLHLYIKAWEYKPFSIIPMKRIIKCIFINK
jgi:glycosyltransferase involved in cell wall biosynthesis